MTRLGQPTLLAILFGYLVFLANNLGSACVAWLWPALLRKLVRVSKEQRITSISGSISSRYGKSADPCTLVAVTRPT